MHSTDKSRYKEPLSPLTNYQGPKNYNLLMWFISINIYILDIRTTENLKYFYTTSFPIIASPLHITTIPWFYNKIFSKTKKKSVKTAGFLFSAFQLLWYVVLVKLYEQNLASHRYTAGKKGGVY